MIQIQEAENQIVTHYDVFAERPSDRHLLADAVKAHQEVLGRVPALVAADAGYYARNQETAVQDMGVKYISVPNRSTHSKEQPEATKTPLVQTRATLADRVGRTNQYAEAQAWVGSLSLSWVDWFPNVGSVWE